jgi:hypothetical protein
LFVFCKHIFRLLLQEEGIDRARNSGSSFSVCLEEEDEEEEDEVVEIMSPFVEQAKEGEGEEEEEEEEALQLLVVIT